MRKNRFELFVTGFRDDGLPADPVFLGSFVADCFENAVLQFKHSTACGNPDLVDLKRMTFWGKPIYNGIDQLNAYEN